MQEEWRDIAGYEGLYQVSNFGRVLHKTSHRIYSNGTRTELPERFLTLTKNSGGYMQVTLWRNGKRISAKVHSLVANAFIKNPENKPYVNHINGDKTDNRAENLEWTTPSENTLHRYRVLGKTKCGPSGKKVKCINTGEVFNSLSDASRATGIPVGNISSVCTKKAYRGYIRHTAGGKRWEFC